MQRAVVEQLLLENLGTAVANEARFQQVVDRVLNTMRDDPAIAQVLADAVRDVRAGFSDCAAFRFLSLNNPAILLTMFHALVVCSVRFVLFRRMDCAQKTRCGAHHAFMENF